MTIAASLGITDTAERRSRQTRRELQLQATLTDAAGSSQSVAVLDLSEAGMLLKTRGKHVAGERILVNLGTGDDHSATIMWSSERLQGCQFDAPLSKGMLSAALLRSETNQTSALESALKRGRRGIDPGEGCGSAIANRRKAKGLTQADLAALVGVSKTSVWKWENGTAQPRRTMMARLSELLGDHEIGREVGSGAIEVPVIEPVSHLPPGRFEHTDLEATVRQSKQAIARAAGTAPDRITIHIEI